MSWLAVFTTLFVHAAFAEDDLISPQRISNGLINGINRITEARKVLIFAPGSKQLVLSRDVGAEKYIPKRIRDTRFCTAISGKLCLIIRQQSTLTDIKVSVRKYYSMLLLTLRPVL